jgi:hypothetical protein
MTAPAIAPSPRGYTFRHDTDQTDLIHWPGLHEGKGVIEIKFFFRTDGAAKPARLLLYTIPPGASEGVHTHKRGDTKLGSFDEFYYILAGTGEIQIEGQKTGGTGRPRLHAQWCGTRNREHLFARRSQGISRGDDARLGTKPITAVNFVTALELPSGRRSWKCGYSKRRGHLCAELRRRSQLCPEYLLRDDTRHASTPLR